MTEVEFETAEDLPEEGPPQSVQRDAQTVIDQLIKRFGSQLQRETFENALLATDVENLRTLLIEAQAEKAEADSAVVELGQQCDSQQSYIEQLEKRNAAWHLASIGEGDPLGLVSPADDPQEVDAFRAMASGQPGLASGPSPADK